MKISGDITALVSQLNRLMGDSAREKKGFDGEIKDALHEASTQEKLKANFYKHEKAMNDYYVSQIHDIPIVGGGISLVATASQDDLKSVVDPFGYEETMQGLGINGVMLNPQRGTGVGAYYTAREEAQAEYQEAGAAGEAVNPAYDNVVGRTLAYADRGKQIENQDKAGAADVRAEQLEKRFSDAKERVSDANEQIRQSASDQRALNDELRRMGDGLNKRG